MGPTLEQIAEFTGREARLIRAFAKERGISIPIKTAAALPTEKVKAPGSLKLPPTVWNKGAPYKPKTTRPTTNLGARAQDMATKKPAIPRGFYTDMTNQIQGRSGARLAVKG